MQVGCIDCGVFTILAMDFLSRADSGTFPSAHEVKHDRAAAALLKKPWEHDQESVGEYRRHIFDCICRSEWQRYKACAVVAVGEGRGEGEGGGGQ